jgi:hypothetical protein
MGVFPRSIGASFVAHFGNRNEIAKQSDQSGRIAASHLPEHVPGLRPGLPQLEIARLAGERADRDGHSSSFASQFRVASVWSVKV